ncbi:MAG TPA: hypothetical protein DCS07_12425, partial [Bdellovibrionales bacterium]|nr:hypothetical protein [Bdellovibrionales bacterium]
PLDQSVYDYSLIGQSKQMSRVHVATTLQKNVATHLHACHEADLDPDLVTTEAWAYRTAFNRMTTAHPDTGPLLLVQIGHERTTIYCHHNGQPMISREVLWGGRDLTSAICRTYAITLGQAEQTKLDNGFILPEMQREEATREQISFSDSLLEPTQGLLRELRQALLTAKTETKQQISTIYLAGGTSLLPGLLPFLEEHLGTEVRPFQALSALSSSGVTYSEQSDAIFALATSLAMCMVGPERSSSINFRRGTFVKHARSREFDTQALRRVFLGTGAILASFFLSLFVQSYYYKDKLTDVNSQLEKNIRTFFGSVSASGLKTYMGSTTTLRKDLNKELEKQRDLYKLLGPNPHSPLDFLKELSMTVPRDIVVDLLEFRAGAAPAAPFSGTSDTSASLSFLVNNPQTAERLSTLFLSKQPGLQPGKTEEVSSPEPGGKKWKITFSGKLQEDAYGK